MNTESCPERFTQPRAAEWVPACMSVAPSSKGIMIVFWAEQNEAGLKRHSRSRVQFSGRRDPRYQGVVCRGKHIIGLAPI
jgi:hypothetical protein